VPPGQSLTILPGVEVLFQVYCKLIVDSAATLRAVGTPADSIRFDVLLPNSSWHGIRFLSASDSSRLEYCLLTHGSATGGGEDLNGGAIYCRSSSPTISHNTISGNSAYCGGGICCENSSPIISDNSITGNSSMGSGGGICCVSNSSPTISGNTISENSARDGGGIMCYESSNPDISGNTITQNNTSWGGGGIYCYWGSSPSISGNTISENDVYWCGGGICCSSSSPIIIGNTIRGNSSGGNGSGIACWTNSCPSISGNTISQNSGNAGGGIDCEDFSSPSISGNTISENDGSWSGGGISCIDSSPIINGNTIIGNSGTGSGGGIECYRSSFSISGNTISGNSAITGGGIYCCDNSDLTLNGNTISGNSASSSGGGIRCQSSSDATLVNCIIWGNSFPPVYLTSGSHLQMTYCDIQDTLWPGEGNIRVAPLFVNPSSGDYHLQSTVGSFHGGSWLPDLLYSPCIDAGDPSSPFALEPMPNGGRVNMGFEGNTLEASLSTNTSVSVPIAELPTEFRLYAPYPNPFNPVTEIVYSVPQAGLVSLRVYDILGRQVAVLVNGFSTPGTYRTTFNGNHLSSGIYYARLRAGTHSETCKMVLLK
jgi:parallel beta-helix repeat protein